MIYLLAIILFVIVCFCIVIYMGWKKLTRYNQSPLYIKTFDGSNSPYHPSVLYKENGFAGYNYIMSETPFYLSLPNDGENYRDQFECPSIHFSNDGIYWEETIPNPISTLTDEQRNNRDYYSDPDLIMTPVGIECWYRINRRYGDIHKQDNISLLRKKSKDGITWSHEEEIINLELFGESTVLGKIVISPAVIYDEGKYKLWFVDNISPSKTCARNICYAECDTYLKRWECGEKIKMNGLDISPWHIHVCKDKNIFWLIVYDKNNISLWKGQSETSFSFIRTLLRPSKSIGSFFSHSLYRACLVKINEGKYRLYFSGNDLFKTYIGIMEGDSPENLSLTSVNNAHFRSFPPYVVILMKTKYTETYKKLAYYILRIRGIVVSFFTSKMNFRHQ